jgi:hypothetical protein
MPARTWLGLLCAAAAVGVAAAQERPPLAPPAPATLPVPSLPLPAELPGGGFGGAPPPLPAPTGFLGSLLPPLADIDGTSDPVPVASNAGFIDPVSPWNVVRLRFDAGYGMNRPTRNDVFITGSGARDRGLPIPEQRIDYQELWVYAEYAIYPQWSVWIELPERWLNPDFNTNHDGPSDLRTGVKLLGLYLPCFTASGQFTLTIPTGRSPLGLGPGHPSLQADILTNWRPYDQFIVEGTFGLWVPINDSIYGGEMLLYGISLSYGEHPPDKFWWAPVLEFDATTSIRGQEQVVFSRTSFLTKPSEGDTIVNCDLGVRAGFGCLGDVYVGYSRALTGEVWHKDLLRVEMRVRY